MGVDGEASLERRRTNELYVSILERLYGDVCRRLMQVWRYGEVICKGFICVQGHE